MDVCVYKDNILEENFYIIESSPKYELYGINLTKLYNSKKTFLIYTTDIAFEDFYIVDDKDILFDENISKFFKCLFKKEQEILKRAEIYGLKEKYQEILNNVKKLYGILMEE